MQEVQRGGHFQIFKVIFADMEARVACGMANDWSATLGEEAICDGGVAAHFAFGPIT
jgi:hypothetical protein